MAHKRKDTRVQSPEWWKHLRPYNKKRVAKAERRAGRTLISAEESEKDSKKQRRPRRSNG